jgi:hypothetical protein
MRLALAAVFGVALAGAAGAGAPEVVEVHIRREPEGTYAFSVSVRHADEGWSHYADRYEVLAPDGRVLATRVLRHPHVKEQPVTRDLDGVRIPAGIEEVRVRAHDLVHGYGAVERVVAVPRE